MGFQSLLTAIAGGISSFTIIGQDGTISSLGSFSRASAGTTENTQGVFTQAPVNTPRYQWVSGKRGLLVEPAVTNMCLWSGDLSNATWVKNGGLSFSGDYITVGGAADQIYQAFTVTPSTQYTFSFFAKKDSMLIVKYSVYNVTGATDIVSVTDYAGTLNTTSYTLVKLTFTTPAGCTSIRCYPTRDSGVLGSFYAKDFQFETGGTATSRVITTTSAVTRAADVLSITPTSIGFDRTKGTFVCSVNLNSGSSNSTFFDVNNGSITLGAYRYAGNGHIVAESAGTSTEPTYSSVVNTPFTFALSYDGGGFSIAANNTIATNPISSVQSPLLNIINIGVSRLGTGQMSGVMFSLAYTSRRFSDTELQAATV